MNKEEILGAFSLVNNPIVLSEEEVKDVQKAIKKLQQENQELKLELSGYRQAILEDKEMLGLKEESEELKKQVESKYEKVGTLTGELLYEENTKLINQQKAFINYLESWKENEEYCYLASNPIDRCRKDIYEEVLQKYKSIIGDDK